MLPKVRSHVLELTSRIMQIFYAEKLTFEPKFTNSVVQRERDWPINMIDGTRFNGYQICIDADVMDVLFKWPQMGTYYSCSTFYVYHSTPTQPFEPQ